MTASRPVNLPAPPRGSGHPPRPGGRAAGIGLIVLSSVSFGVMPILAKLVYRSGAQPVGLLAVRFPIAAALLGLLVVTRGDPGAPPLRAAGRRTLLALGVLGAVGYSGQALSYFAALTYASASLVALLFYVYPAFVVVLAAVALRHRPRPAAICCLALAMAGMAVTIGPVGGGQVTGALLAVLAALFYAVYIVVGSRVTPRVGALRATAVIMAGAAVTLVATAAVTHPRLPGTPAGWMALSGLVVVCTVLAPLTFFAGLARVGPTDAATISTVEPVVSVLLGVLVLGEHLSTLQLTGAVLVLAAVIALARLSGRTTG